MRVSRQAAFSASRSRGMPFSTPRRSDVHSRAKLVSKVVDSESGVARRYVRSILLWNQRVLMTLEFDVALQHWHGNTPTTVAGPLVFLIPRSGSKCQSSDSLQSETACW